MIDRREFLRRGATAALGVTAMAAAARAAAATPSHRLSVAWPSVQPAGCGSGDVKVLDRYSRKIDSILEAGLRPMATLFEGDLPQAICDDGGWSVPDTAHRFADYARIVAGALGDRVARWILLDKPSAFLLADFVDPHSLLPASHVVNLAVGRGFRAVRAVRSDARMGTAVRLAACEPATDSARDAAAAERSHRFENAWFLDPILRGVYPNAFLEKIPYDLMQVRDGDLETTRVPLDFVGLDLLGRRLISHDPEDASRIGLSYTASCELGPRIDRDRKRVMRLRVERDYRCRVIEL